MTLEIAGCRGLGTRVTQPQCRALLRPLRNAGQTSPQPGAVEILCPWLAQEACAGAELASATAARVSI